MRINRNGPRPFALARGLTTVPTLRATRCVGPPRRAAVSLRNRGVTAGITLGALVIQACSSSGPTGTGNSGIGGSWGKYTESFADSVTGEACSDTASLVLSASGSTFSGYADQIGSCTVGGHTLSNVYVAPISEGRTHGDSLSWEENNEVGQETRTCHYVGVFSGSPPTGAHGTASCEQNNSSLAGTWQMTR
jgi:hypothetical protein